MIAGPGWMDVKPSSKTARVIYEWATKVCDFTKVEKASDLHITQIFVGGNDRYDIFPNEQRTYTCRFNDMALFGNEHNVLVLLVTSPSLQLRFREFQDVGYKHTYPQYQPHITLKEPAAANMLNTARKHLPKLKQLLPSFSVSGEIWHKTK